VYHSRFYLDGKKLWSGDTGIIIIIIIIIIITIITIIIVTVATTYDGNPLCTTGVMIQGMMSP